MIFLTFLKSPPIFFAYAYKKEKTTMLQSRLLPKRTAIQETVLDAVCSYNEVVEIGGKSTVRTGYALPKFTIPDDKILLVELYEKNSRRHQTIRVENEDIVNAAVINELKIK